jgi:hypothetical protein
MGPETTPRQCAERQSGGELLGGFGGTEAPVAFLGDAEGDQRLELEVRCLGVEPEPGPHSQRVGERLTGGARHAHRHKHHLQSLPGVQRSASALLSRLQTESAGVHPGAGVRPGWMNAYLHAV